MGNIFNIDDTREEIIEKINNAQGVIETINIGLAFLNYKFQKELLENQKKLLEDQNDYNRKQLCWSRILAFATIAPVLVTLVTLLYHFY